MNEVRVPIEGVLIGHHTDAEARTGCTVLVLPDGSIASGEVRGGAPATREFALLDPTKSVARIDAVVMSGGSAFGLAACDGVMQWCAAHERGFETVAGRVPIVVGMALFDLSQGEASVRPSAYDGERAADRAHPVAEGIAGGHVGAGTGTTVGKWRGADHVRPGGLGVAVMYRGPLVVAAIVAVNAVGDIDDGTVVRSIADGSFAWPSPPEQFGEPEGPPLAQDRSHTGPSCNTTIGTILTNAVIDKTACRLVAESGHDGLARALFPAHTRSDGDALVAVSVPQLVLDEAAGFTIDTVRVLATVAVEHAVRSIT